MLQQILNDMYIEPELLAELDEEQKQILFCKMREEQIRRWKEREEKLHLEEDKNTIITNTRKKKDGGKKVTFLMGVDGEPMVVVLGGEDGANREDVDSILEERAKRQADLEADMLKRAAEEELDKLVRLSRSTVEAMEEEATRTVQSKVRDPAREAVVRSLQEATVEMEGQIQALEEAEAQQRKLSSSSSSSSSSGASSPLSPSPSSSSSISSSSSSGIGSIGSSRLALSSSPSPSTSSLSSLSSFASSQPPSPPAFTISAYGASTTFTPTSKRVGAGPGVSMWEAVNRASHFPSSSTASSTSPTSSSSNFSNTVKPPILSPKPTVTTPHPNGTQPASPPQPLSASPPSPSPPSSLSSTTSSLSSSSSPPPASTEVMERGSVQATSPSTSVVGVAAQIRRFEQLSEGSLEALKTATLERAKKRREREIFEHLRSQVEAARQQAASADPEAASRQQQAAEKDDIAWQEQERKAKEAERRIREIARRAREEHRRASHNTPPPSPPITALNYNLNGLSRLANGIHGPAPTTTPPAGDINGNVNSVADDISNNNDTVSLKKYSSSSGSPLSSPGMEGMCVRQRLRPPKPPSRAAIITWFRDEELPRGAGLDPSCLRIAPWFHGIISRTEAEEVLSEAGIGCFLVRVSERIWGYTISYRAPDRCRHYLIDITGGKYTFFGSHQASHNSLGDLVEYHKREAITASGGELLTRPCGQLHPRNPDYQELFAGTHYLAA